MPRFSLRRNTRVAGVGPCSHGPIINDSQRRIIKNLGYSTDAARIDQRAQDKYSELFKTTINDVHLSALAAIFGWSTDKMDDPCASGALVGH